MISKQGSWLCLLNSTNQPRLREVIGSAHRQSEPAKTPLQSLDGAEWLVSWRKAGKQSS